MSKPKKSNRFVSLSQCNYAFLRIILSGYEIQYLARHSYLFLLFKAQSIAAVTPAIPGK